MTRLDERNEYLIGDHSYTDGGWHQIVIGCILTGLAVVIGYMLHSCLAVVCAVLSLTSAYLSVLCANLGLGRAMLACEIACVLLAVIAWLVIFWFML